MAKQLDVRGRILATGQAPLVCTPLVGTSRDHILAETSRVLAKGPDLLEWRVDCFEGIGATGQVIEVAQGIRKLAEDTPVLFTRRSIKEGGEPISLSEEEVVALYEAVCDEGSVDLIDFEMGNDPEHIRRLRAVSRAHNIKMIMSYHNFQETPGLDYIWQRFAQAQDQQADIGKVAVMPKSLDDVLTLLTATLRASETLDIPLISMSMGGYGSLSRLFGWVFGSTVSFAVGDRGSAPGQVPIEDLNTVIGIVHKAIAKG